MSHGGGFENHKFVHLMVSANVVSLLFALYY